MVKLTAKTSPMQSCGFKGHPTPAVCGVGAAGIGVSGVFARAILRDASYDPETLRVCARMSNARPCRFGAGSEVGKGVLHQVEPRHGARSTMKGCSDLKSDRTPHMKTRHFR